MKALKAPKAKAMKAMKAPKANAMPKAKAMKAMKARKAKAMKAMKDDMKARKAKAMKSKKATWGFLMESGSCRFLIELSRSYLTTWRLWWSVDSFLAYMSSVPCPLNPMPPKPHVPLNPMSPCLTLKLCMSSAPCPLNPMSPKPHVHMSPCLALKVRMGVSDRPPMGASDPWWAQVTHGRKWLTFHGRKWPPCPLEIRSSLTIGFP